MAGILFLLVAAQTAKRAEAAGGIVDSSRPTILLNATRKLSSDLEVGGELAGLPPGSIRYVPLATLLTLSQTVHTVTDDTNFIGPTRIAGVPLED